MRLLRLLYSIFFVFIAFPSILFAQANTLSGVENPTKMLDQDLKSFGIGELLSDTVLKREVSNVEVFPEQLYKKLQSHVVRVFVIELDQDGRESKTLSSGSAVAISESYLITNCHIFTKNYDQKKHKIILQTNNFKSVAEIYRDDLATDRCVLHDKQAQHKAVRGFRSKESILVGERVYSLGNPRGFDNAFSEGLISAIKKNNAGRMVLLTTAAIAKGSSGGALFDRDGNLVGITMAVIKDAPHMGIAIPVEDYIK